MSSLTEHELLEALESEDRFDELFHSMRTLVDTAEEFPKLAERILKQSKIFTDETAFNKFVCDAEDIGLLAKQFPKHLDELIQCSKIFTDQDAFDRLIRNDYEGFFILAKNIPTYSEDLYKKVMNDDDFFNMFLQGDLENFFLGLNGLVDTFPVHEYELIKKAALAERIEKFTWTLDVAKMMLSAKSIEPEKSKVFGDRLFSEVILSKKVFDEVFRDCDDKTFLDFKSRYCERVPVLMHATTVKEARIAVSEMRTLHQLNHCGLFGHSTQKSVPREVIDNIHSYHSPKKSE